MRLDIKNQYCGKPGVSSDLIKKRMVSRLAIRFFEFVDSFSIADDVYLLNVYNKIAKVRKRKAL